MKVHCLAGIFETLGENSSCQGSGRVLLNLPSCNSLLPFAFLGVEPRVLSMQSTVFSHPDTSCGMVSRVSYSDVSGGRTAASLLFINCLSKVSP